MTKPFPFPGLPAVMVIQFSLLAAVQAQFAVAVTVTFAFPPASAYSR